MEKITTFDKAQKVRLMDVFLIAPILFVVALKEGKLSESERTAIGIIGVTTLIYNGLNYLKN
jgi:hypothetical protein